MRDFKKIKAYQLADDLCILTYQMTQSFPQSELYGLTSQIRRAAVSVVANITEGASRQTIKDYLHFLYIARGSLAELQYLISLSERLGYAPHDKVTGIVAQADETARTLFGLIQAVALEVK